MFQTLGLKYETETNIGRPSIWIMGQGCMKLRIGNVHLVVADAAYLAADHELCCYRFSTQVKTTTTGKSNLFTATAEANSKRLSNKHGKWGPQQVGS